MNSSLNHIFRTIWSDALGTWIAVSEIIKSKGKRSVSGLVRALRNELSAADSGIHRALGLKPILLALLCCFSSPALANPTGGAVANGQASFSTSGNTLTVTNTPGTIINWQDFSIQSGEVTRFAQQSAASTVLNRVVTSNPSSILGSLQSNGRVFLVNPNGIVFGQGATVDVAGMVATTLKLSDADFLSGRNNFGEQAGAQNISNAGNITAESGGQIYLIAPNVENTGIINAPNGEILLAAGHSVELVDSSNPNLRVNITAPAGEATNVGQLVASAGNLGLFGTVVKNSGTVSASSATLQGGKIVFKASQRVEAGGTVSAQGVGGGSIEVLADMQNGTVEVSGTLDASAPVSGNGGFIETSAAHVNIADSIKVSTAAAMGLAGTWLIDPFDFTIAATGGNMTGATLSSSLIGGNVSILSTSGTTGTLGDVNVNDSVSWSANLLTLNAQNNININTTMNASGTASLALEYGQQALAASNTSNYFLNNGAQINLPAGLNFSTRLGSDGIAKNYTVITTLGAAGSTTGADLQGINGGLAANYVLGSNIDATATSTWNTGAGFAPIGDATTPFAGSFDGLGHSITNLTINRTAIDYVGLFGYIATGSAANNVGLLNASVSGLSNVGALVGASSFGAISNSYATGTVTGVSTVGGLLGYNFRASVSNSHFSGSVSGTSNVGGLVGYGYGNHTIKNSYSTGTVTGGLSGTVGGLLGLLVQGTVTNSYSSANVVGGNSGGLVGWSFGSGGRIEYSYATGNVSGNLYAGGLVGAADQLAGGVTFSYATGLVNGAGIKGGLVGWLNLTAVSNSYWDTQTSGLATSAGGTGLTTAQFFTASNFAGFTFGTVGGTANQWVIVDADGTLNNAASAAGNTRPMLLSEYTTNISSANQLQLMALNLNTNYSLVANIDATTTNGTSNPSGMWGSAGFVPIGNSTTQFAATFDGLGHSISSFNINRPAASFVGMFGYQNNAAIIRNIGLLNASVTGSGGVGGLVGYNYGGTINNSYVSGSVTGTGGTGGLVGINYGGGVISNSYTTGSVAGSTANTGGLVGSDGTGLISNSYSTASVSGGNTGGLVGNTNYGSISNSYATGNVSGSGYTGGLVGSNTMGTVSNSYATGNVSGSKDTGGLVGYNYGGAVNTSYSTGLVSVTGAGTPGGLVGVSASGGTVTSSYWDMTTSGQTLSGGGTGYNTAQFFTASNFTGFTFGTVGGTVNQWVIVDADGTLNNALGAAGATRPMLLSEYSTTISNLHQLQLMEVNLAANYTLATDIDATATNGTANPSGMWGSAGFVPIGNFTTAFNGQFDGLNHTISNLTVNQGALDNIGLFGYVTSYLGVGLIQNVGLLYCSITGGSNVGGLAGRLDAASVSNIHTMGIIVSGSGLNIGGLVGLSTSTTSTISNSTSNSSVIGTGTSASASVGGLVGNNQGTISSSYSYGFGRIATSTGGQVGGLVGYNQGTIIDSFSEITVDGVSQVGGLVGYSYLGSISNSHASGNVTGTGSSVGGLVGDNSFSSITNSYATPVSISGGSNVGGLVGFNYGTIINSHYDIDAVTINGAKNVTLGGLYNTGGTGQFSDWITNALTLNIANYSATLLPGTVNNYTINSLQGMKDLLAFADNSAYSFTLAADIDLVSAAGYYIPVFNGLFDGAGFTISNLNVNLPGNSNIGLFGSIASTTTIQNVGLLNASVTGASRVGGLVGNTLGGTISNSYVNGSVIGNDYVGGLVGYLGISSTISTSYATGSVSGTGSYGYVGGLVGYNNYGSIDNNSATANVSGSNDVGGLVGYNRGGLVSNSFATGSVTGSGYNVGGLIGMSSIVDVGSATVSNSYATGNVSGTTYVGGLVGYNGGLTSNISNSYASGSVTGTVSDVGGLVGFNFGIVNNSYASGSVTGAASNIGGLAGTNDPMASITSSFWNTQTSGLLNAVGVGDATGITGLNTPAMMSQASFTGFDFAGTWVMYEGYTAPLLRSFMKALTVTAFDATKTYDGFAYSSINALNYSITPDANLLGTASYSSGTNAGSYVLTPGGLYSNQQGYIITYVSGALTITPAALSITANNASKTYDGQAYSGGNGVVYSGFVNGETSTVLGGTLAYGGTAQNASNAGSYVLSSSGLTSGNYAISYTDGALTVTQATLNITANDAIKTYDGLAYSGGNGVVYSGFVNGETSAVLGGTLAYGGTAQGATQKGSYLISAGGLTSGNYVISFVDGTLTINPNLTDTPPSSIAEIVQISLLSDLHSSGDANEQEEKPVLEELLIADADVTASNSVAQSLPICK